jgi:NitT/TauT family transport system permease protein
MPPAAIEADPAQANASLEAARSRAASLALRRWLLPAAGFILLFAVWEGCVDFFAIAYYVLPAPSAIARYIFNNLEMLIDNLQPTAEEAALGFLLGNAAGIVVATAFVYSRVAEEAFYPLAVMINTIPVVAIAPILVLLFGSGIEPKAVVAAFICFFPTLVNMTRGLRNVSPQQVELMRILSASPREIFFKLRLPNSVPFLFSAFKVAATTSVLGALAGEWIGSTDGIGALMIQATYSMDSNMLYASIVFGSLLSACFFGIIAWAEWRVLQWNSRRGDT